LFEIAAALKGPREADLERKLHRDECALEALDLKKGRVRKAEFYGGAERWWLKVTETMEVDGTSNSSPVPNERKGCWGVTS
jgi:hypothetical protein